MVSAATSGYQTFVKRGDGGVGAGVQASKTIGTSNQALKILAKLAGTAGNSKTFGITVSGTASYSQVITANSVAIVSASSSGTATTTVAQAISALYLDSTFVANFQATVSTGDGSGVLVNGASGVLSGGSAGTEIFTTIAEVKSVGGPNMQGSTIDVTSMDSANRTREFISSLIDPGDLTWAMNFLPATAGHQGIYTDMLNGTKRNFQIVWTDAASTTCALVAIVTGYQITSNIDAALEANITTKITGTPTWF